MKHPRAANFAWRCENGKYLYWFHNHGGRFIREHPQQRTIAYNDRNPVWLSGGVEADSPKGKIIQWSEPEIGLYDDDPMVRMSYPDLVEEGGEYYLTETQKDVARVHKMDRRLIEGLWQPAGPSEGVLLRVDDGKVASVAAPEFPLFVKRSRRADYGTDHTRAGVSFDLFFRLENTAAGLTLVDNPDSGGRGFAIRTARGNSLEITVHDGRTQNRWSSDEGVLTAGKLHHAVIVVDGGPNVISFVVDGKFNDGLEQKQFGWGRFHPQLHSLNGGPKLRLDPHLMRLLIYGRVLRTAEAIASFRTGLAIRR